MGQVRPAWRHSGILLAVASICVFLCLFLYLTRGAQADDGEATTVPAESASSEEATVEVGVFYLTNRRRQDASGTFGGERGDPSVGRCEVEFTPLPIINEVAARMPFYVKRESTMVRIVEQVEVRLFWKQLGSAVGRTRSGSVILFVHGYNYGFERTCRMAAEMQRSLQDHATVLAFSWPSNGLPTDYARDQTDIEWSVPELARLISRLGDEIGSANVQVVAHSLGSRGVVFALQRLALDRDARPAIGRLVLFAPDFDSETFVELLPGLAPMVGGITLYASDNDTPLKLSHQLSGYPRLGEAGEYLTVVDGMDTIDVSSLGRYQITGHEYFYFHPVVTTDLVTLLGTGAPAAQRAGLRSKQRDGIRHWVFEETGQ